MDTLCARALSTLINQQTNKVTLHSPKPIIRFFKVFFNAVPGHSAYLKNNLIKFIFF